MIPQWQGQPLLTVVTVAVGLASVLAVHPHLDPGPQGHGRESWMMRSLHQPALMSLRPTHSSPEQLSRTSPLGSGCGPLFGSPPKRHQQPPQNPPFTSPAPVHIQCQAHGPAPLLSPSPGQQHQVVHTSSSDAKRTKKCFWFWVDGLARGGGGSARFPPPPRRVDKHILGLARGFHVH